MTLFMHDKRPKKGMFQAAKEQGFEEAMQQVDALEAEIERLRLERNQLDAQARKLRAALEAMLDEFGEFAMPSVRRARAALDEETK